MKKLGVLAAAAVLAMGLVSCGSTVTGSGVKGKSASVKKTYRQMADYQGSTFGKEVPEWVMKVAEGNYTQSALSPVMPDLKGKKIFVVTGRGDNLDFVRTWCDQVDVEVQVASQMERVAARSAQTHLKGKASASGVEADPTEVQKTIDQATHCATLVKLNGLEKVADYWTFIEEYADKKMDGDPVKAYFEYYSVWAMDEKMYSSQMATAVESVDDQMLKDVLAKSLFNVSGVSNDESVNNEIAGLSAGDTVLEAVVKF